MPDMFGCRCSCVDPRLLSIAIGDDHFAMKRYQFNATCLTKPIQFDTGDYQPTWDGVAEFLETPYTFCDDPTTITATMTAAGIDIGDVEISIFDDASNLIARYLNDVVWQPNCDTQFVLVEYDPACSCGEWQQYPCLQPLVEPCSDCECDLSQVVFTVEWSGVSTAYPTTETSYPGFNALVDGKFTLECISAAELSALSIGINSGDCFWIAIATLQHTNASDSIRIYCVVQFFKSGDGGAFNVHLLFDESSGPLSTGALVSVNVGTEGGWCEDDPWDLTDFLHPTFGISAIVNAVAIPETVRPEIRFNCDPGNDPADCNGESLWTLKAWAIGALYQFYWELDSETCNGAVCNNGKVCNPAPPFDVPTYLIDEGQATALEILDRIDEQIAGYCGCVDPYVPPEEPDYCNGTSSWTLRRTLCPGPGDLYLYYWEPDSNTCEGDCSDSKTCFPQPPYPLSEFPMDDGEATSLGYLDALNESDTGECGCADDGYSIPECPQVCEGDCVYEIVGYASDNGTFGVQTGDRTVAITDDGTPSGNEQGTVYLEVLSDTCDGLNCGCSPDTLYNTIVGFWGGGGFPSDDSALGDTRTYDCEEI